MTRVLEVIEPGMSTTIQDRGRHGYQAFGMPVAGAVDEYSHRIANILVGNREVAAALEITLLGPRLRVLAPTKLALTGADLGAHINGERLSRWQTVAVNQGDEINFTAVVEGCRAYLAVAGGIEVPVVMGSRSTYLRAGIGGLEGRSLKAGDFLGAGSFQGKNIPVGTKLDAALIPGYPPRITLRVIPGPQGDHFTSAGRGTFLNSEYTVTAESDRMGCRLEGPVIKHKCGGGDIISDGIPPGAVQVPGHGQPIVMLADRQTTGGYPKIATVCSVDMGRIGQVKPGDRIQFATIDRKKGVQLLKERETAIKEWARTLPEAGRAWHFTVNMGGQRFSAWVEEI